MSLAIFEIVKPGFLTTIQDQGRFFYQWRGVSIAGALDSFSHRVGNILVGNSENAAGLEMTVYGPTLRILQDTTIAITGANMSPMKNSTFLPMWASVKVRQGDVISFGPLKEGCRSYLSVRNGILVPPLLGSRSTNLTCKEGGKEGRSLRTGDILEGEPIEDVANFRERRLLTDLIPTYSTNPMVRVILGPQTRFFEKNSGMKTFLYSEYIVTPQVSRAGYRLDGPEIHLRKAMETSIPSEACCMGGVQVPENGKPIILMAEQHGGGYPKIAVVISSDLDQLAQLKPGDKIRFEKVSVSGAHRILKSREIAIQTWKEGKN